MEWAGHGPYAIEGTHFSVSTQKTTIPEIGQGSVIRPYQQPHPPIVVTAVAPHSKGVTEAAKRGWQPISANFLLPEWVASHWPRYVEGRLAVGAQASPVEWRVVKSIFVADDERTARDYGLGVAGPHHLYFRHLVRKLVGLGGRANLFKSDPAEPDARITPDYVTGKLVIAGTVNSVVDQLLAFREQTGAFGTLLYGCHDWADPALAKRSMQLMAEDGSMRRWAKARSRPHPHQSGTGLIYINRLSPADPRMGGWLRRSPPARTSRRCPRRQRRAFIAAWRFQRGGPCKSRCWGNRVACAARAVKQ